MTATMNQKNSQNSTKKSKDKRLLIGAIIVAIIIIIGATFAWLTSSDTVTNRLTASANYGVAITEQFEPPTIWTPGEEVTKEVSVINTGNIDAFVHVTFDNTMEFTAEEKGEGQPEGGVIDIDTDGTTSWVVLTSDEAHAMMAGGFLAYNSNVTATTINDENSLYPAIASDASEIEGDPNDYVRYWYKSGTTYTGYGAQYNGVSIGEVTTDFRPTESGYYIFRREVGSDEGTTTYEYEGYYAYVTDSELSDYSETSAYWDTYEVDGKTYYALYYKIDLSDLGTNFTVGTDGSLFKTGESDPDIMQSKTTTVEPTFSDEIENETGDDAPEGYYITATYEDITIRIYLNGTWSSSGGVYTNGDWTGYYDGSAWHFCYNDDLSAGQTTEELISSLYLVNETSDQVSWTGFTYDLNVTADSIQVTVNTANKETYEAWYAAASGEGYTWGLVISNAEDTNYTDGLTYEDDDEEIALITWAVPVP